MLKWKFLATILTITLLVGLSNLDVWGHRITVDGLLQAHEHIRTTTDGGKTYWYYTRYEGENGGDFDASQLREDEWDDTDNWGHAVTIDNTATCWTLGTSGGYALGDSDTDPVTGEKCGDIRRGRTGSDDKTPVTPVTTPQPIVPTPPIVENDTTDEEPTPQEDIPTDPTGAAVVAPNARREIRKPLPKLSITHVDRIDEKSNGWFIYVRNEERRFVGVGGMTLEIWHPETFATYLSDGQDFPEFQKAMPKDDRLTYQYSSERKHPEFTNSEGIRANNRIYIGTKKPFEDWGNDGSVQIRLLIHYRNVPKNIEEEVVVIREAGTTREPLSGRIITYYPKLDSGEEVAASPMKPAQGKLVTMWGKMKYRSEEYAAMPRPTIR